jgi:hypothetical protein
MGRFRLALLLFVALLVHIALLGAVSPAAGRDRALTDRTEDPGLFRGHRGLGGSGGRACAPPTACAS